MIQETRNVNKKRLCDYKILYRVRHEGGEITINNFSSLLTSYVPRLSFDRYVVLKETKHTYLVTEVYYPFLTDGDFFDPLRDAVYTDTKRFFKTATNRFAWETKELAMADFTRKQQWRKKRLLQELEECEAIVRKAELYRIGEDKNNVY